MNFWQRAVCIVLAVLMLSAVIGCGKQPAVSDPASGPDSSAPPSNDVPDVTDPPGGGGATVDPTGTSDSGSPTTPGGKATGSTAKAAGTTKAPQGDTPGGINMKDPKNPYANIPAKLNGTTVKFLMYWDPNKLDKAKFRAFEKTTGIKVQAVVSPEVTQKLSTMITAEEAPDVVRFGDWPASTELLQDISVAKMNLSDPVWDQSVLKATTFKGKRYGINTFGEKAINFYVVYNDDLFADNGFTSPGEYYKKGQWNMKTFEQACRDISSLGSDMYGYACGNRYEFAYAAGIPGVVSYENGKFVSHLTDRAFVESLRFVAQGYKEKILLYDWTPGCEQFNGGKVGMIYSSNYGLEKEGFFKNAKFTIKAVPVPEPVGAEKYDRIYGLDAFGVPQKAENPEGAGYFMRYYLDPQYDGLDTLFISKELREFHFNELKTKKKRSMDMSSLLVLSGDSYLEGNIGWTAATTDPQQIEVLLNGYKNMVDKAVQVANARYG